MTELSALSVICDLDRSKKELPKDKIIKRYQSNLKNTKWVTLKPHKGSKTSYYKQCYYNKKIKSYRIYERQ